MPSHAATRLASFVPVAVLLAVAAGCGSATAPSPTQQTETFTGTLQPLGTDFKTFTIVYTQASSDLSVTVDSLKTVAASTPVTGITIGIGFGAVSGSSCSLQIQTPTAALATELFAPNGASAGIVLRPDLRLPDWNDRLLLDAHGTRHVFDDGQALLTPARRPPVNQCARRPPLRTKRARLRRQRRLRGSSIWSSCLRRSSRRTRSSAREQR